MYRIECWRTRGGFKLLARGEARTRVEARKLAHTLADLTGVRASIDHENLKVSNWPIVEHVLPRGSR